MDLWATVRSEREALAGDLGTLDAGQWSTPSLCAGWTVRDVVAHMVGTAKISPATFFPKLIGAGMRLSSLQAKDIARERGASAAETLTNFEAVIPSRRKPPGPAPTILGETLVHAEDIRRPLGLNRTYPAEAVVAVCEFYKGSNLVLGTKRRITGVTLEATDVDWTHGDGPAVRGPVTTLLLAMTGRVAVLDELEGDGVAVLRSRTA